MDNFNDLLKQMTAEPVLMKDPMEEILQAETKPVGNIAANTTTVDQSGATVIPFAQGEVKTITARIVDLSSQIESMKPLYEELDALTLQLKNLVKEGVRVVDADTRYSVTVEDNFAEKNTIYRAQAAKRFQAKVESAEEVDKRLNKKPRAKKE